MYHQNIHKHAGRPADSDPSTVLDSFVLGGRVACFVPSSGLFSFFAVQLSYVEGVIVGMASSWDIMDGLAFLANSRGCWQMLVVFAWSEWGRSRLQEC